MEIVGDYSQNPFEGLIFDIPITSITKNLEIEILHELEESNIPKPPHPVEGVII
jgi:putative membrane protein